MVFLLLFPLIVSMTEYRSPAAGAYDEMGKTRPFHYSILYGAPLLQVQIGFSVYKEGLPR